MSSNAVREWVPDFIIRAPGFTYDLVQIAGSVDITSGFLHELAIALQAEESIWLNHYLQNQTKDPTLDIPIDAEGQLQYILGWLTIDCYRVTLDKWGKNDPFFYKLSKLVNALHQLETFKDSNFYQNLRGDTKLKFGNGETVSRGSAPLPELMNQTGTNVCRGVYPQLILWLIERSYQTYLHSNKTTVLTRQMFELMNILRNLNSATWSFLAERLKLQRWDHDYLKFRQTVIHHIFHGNLEPQSENFPNSQRIRFLAQKLDEFRAQPIIFLSSNKQPTTLIDNSHKGRALHLQLAIKELESAELTTKYDDLSLAPGSGNEKVASKQNKTLTREQKVLNRPKKISDQSRKWQRSIEESVWSAANPFFNSEIESFIDTFEPNADLPELIQTALTQDQCLDHNNLEILAAVVWLQIKTSQPLANLAYTKSSFVSEEDWQFNTELTKLHRYRPQFDPSTKVSDDHLPNDVVTVQQIDLPHKVTKTLSSYRHFKYPVLELLNPQNPETLSQKQIGRSRTSTDSEIITSSRVLDNLIYSLKLLNKLLHIDHFNWPCHCLRILHNKKTRNLTEGQLLHLRPNELRDASTAYYRKSTKGDVNIAGSIYCLGLSQSKEQMHLICNSIIQKTESQDLYEFWNSVTDLAILHLSLATAPRPLLDPFAETANFDLKNGFLILNDKDLDSRNATRIVPLCEEITSWLKDVYFPLLRELSGRTECKKLAAMLETLSDPNSTRKQRIPLFFHLATDGIKHIGENWIFKYTQNKNLVSNICRHLASSYLELQDRELIDQLLGHQHLKVPIHGSSSTRVRQKDLDAIRVGTTAHLKQFFPHNLPKVQLPAGAHFSGRKYPKSFGEEKRRTDRLTKFGRLKRQVESFANEINKLSRDQRTKAAHEILAVIKSKEKYKDSFKALVSHFCQSIEEVDLSEHEYKPWEGFEERNPIDTRWLKNLNKRQAFDDELIQLLNDHEQLKSVTDLNLLFSLSLVVLNGITDLTILKRTLEEDYQHLSFDDEVHIEYSYEDADPNFAVTRRHRITKISVDILRRLKNGRGRLKRISALNQRPSDGLKDRLRKIGLEEKHSFSIIEKMVELETALQIYQLPTPMTQMASGEIQHRSMDRASLVSFRKSIRISCITEGLIPLVPTERATKRLDQSINRLFEIATTYTDQPNEVLIHLEQLKPTQAASLALKEYLIDLFSRTHLGRPLAVSTKSKYISKLRHFLTATDVLYLIAAGDADAINEEILDFLEALGRKNDEASEYARHIYSFFNTRPLLSLASQIYVPYIQKQFRPRVTVYTSEEINLLARRLANGSNLQALDLLELIAEWGVRTLETSLIKCSRAYIDKKDNIRIYLRGNSSHRLKTSGSNRIILPLDVCDELLKKSLIQQLSTKKTLNNDSFLIDASINESLQTLSRSLNKYIGRGQIYCLRHFFADQLFTPILRQALGLDSPEAAARLAKLNGAPQDSFTLYFAGRLLGHTSPKTSLSHYYHRGFELLDEFYAKSRGLKTKFQEAAIFFPPILDDTEKLTILPKTSSPGVFQENAYRVCAQLIEDLAADQVTSNKYNFLAGHQEVIRTLEYIHSLPTELQIALKGKSSNSCGAIIHLKYLDQLKKRPRPSIDRLKSITRVQPQDYLGIWTRSQTVMSLPETFEQDISILSIIVSSLGIKISDLGFYTPFQDESSNLHEKCLALGMRPLCTPIRHFHTRRIDGRSPRNNFVCIKVPSDTKLSIEEKDRMTVTNSILFGEASALALMTSFCNTLIGLEPI